MPTLRHHLNLIINKLMVDTITKKPVIQLKGVSKSFKVKQSSDSKLRDMFRPQHVQVDAVKDLNFEILQGESVAFLGKNGAGKTTTTKLLSGLLHPTSGEIDVLGYTPFERDPSFLRQIGLVMGGKATLNWDLTPRQNLNLFKMIYEIPDEEFESHKQELLDMLDVADKVDTQVRRLSLGERMKIELIASIIHRPKVMYLDEPTIGLDITSKHRVREFLKNIKEKYGITLLLTSHDMDDIANVSERVLIISDGQIIHDEPLDDMIRNFSDVRYVELVVRSPEDREKLREAISADIDEVIDEKDLSLLVQIPRSQFAKVLSKATEVVELDDIDVQSIPLEEIIEGIMG